MNKAQNVLKKMPGVSAAGDIFRKKVLHWLLSMQTGATQFRMNNMADSTIFTSCFALFIFDILGETKKWLREEKDLWVRYITSYQDKETGYFIPDNYKGDLDTKTVQQLTCFCLSALEILKASPNYKLSFLKKWPQPSNIYDYLNRIGCFQGKPMTGNMAMFLAIFLTYQYEKCGDELALNFIDTWFHWHERTQNKRTGFWGKGVSNKYYFGFQNAFHQLLIYDYWNRPIPNHERIIDSVLLLQDEEGYFAPTPGGWACYDYDAIHILSHAYRTIDHRKNNIENSLKKVFHAIIAKQNSDGGFCQSSEKPSSMTDIFNNRDFFIRNDAPYLAYYRMRNALSILLKGNKTIMTKWTVKGRLWNESNLWDTWLYCLCLAEIANSIEIEKHLDLKNTNFHKMAGIGYFNPRK
ncbi:MAG: hypothetical protein ISS26_01630 [Candidatus Omnitrophica bacterium]|nr:hypothetical protein [Candidatus Omnitrophota bacterium]